MAPYSRPADSTDPQRGGATVHVNGVAHRVDIRPMTTLLEVLRDQLNLTGAKESCGVGECGACTVLVDRAPVLACILLMGDVRGSVTTVEGLGELGQAIGLALATHGGYQCGFCTPGMIIAIAWLLQDPPQSRAAIREGLSGNICRCTGYAGIVQAVEAVVRESASGRNSWFP
jgi:aerobic carbon-monoxide dehydrogenase small subunit